MEISRMSDNRLGDAVEPEFDERIMYDPNSYLESNLVRAVQAADIQRGKLTAPLVAKALNVYDPKDYEGIMSGRSKFAPSTEELLKRAATNKGEKYSALARMMEEYPTARKVIGGLTDVAIDPLTYETIGFGPIAKTLATKFPKLATALNLAEIGIKPVSSAIEKSGEGTYKSAFSKLDAELLKSKSPKIPVSEVFASELKSGNAPSGFKAKRVREKIADLLDKYYGKKESIEKTADISGASVTPNEAIKRLDKLAREYESLTHPDALDEAKAIRNEISKLEQMKPRPEREIIYETERTSPILDEYGNPIKITEQNKEIIPGVPETNVTQGAKEKTYLQKKVPSSAWKEPTINPVATESKIQASSGYRKDVEDAIRKSMGDKAADEYALNNQKISSILGTQGKELGEVTREEAGNLVRSSDPFMIAASQAIGLKPKWYIFKRLADISRMQGPRTMIGKGLYNLGTHPVAGPLTDVAARRGLWSLIGNQYDNEE